MVVVSYKRNDIDEYENSIQKLLKFIVAELKIAASVIGVYNQELSTYNYRKISWIAIISLPCLIFVLTVFIACCKYIVS